MTPNIDQKRVFQEFPGLAAASPEIIKEFFAHGIKASLDKNSSVWTEGDECTNLALILEGCVRVFKLAETGREITLYRINPGESCILTASCVLSHVDFPAFATTETSVEAIAIPARVFRGWVNKYPFWQEYVFNLVSRRFAAIISVVEAVAFQRVDSRIATYLLSGKKTVIKKTHLEIAFEVGSSREVVSRILKDFEHRQILTLSRGAIEISKPHELSQIANII